MKKIAVFSCMSLMGLVAVRAIPGVTVPAPFEARLVATDLLQPKGIEAALHQAGVGPAGDYLYVAESGANRIVRIDPRSGEMEMAGESMGFFPVGVGCFGGPFAQNMYVGNAMGGGISRIDADGVTWEFAVPDLLIAGMDFGHGPFGTDLYAGEWVSGNIWRIDRDGNATLFSTIPGSQTRYMKFSHGGPFGTFLYVTDFLSGDIYRIDPHGAYTLFASTGSIGLEGLDFSSGGAFGKYLYTGNLSTGDLFRIAPDGTVLLWASGFEGVADIRFVPGGAGGFTMYMVDGHDSVFAISRAK
jgi:hypothetical protein